jgi:biopolymer transport protein ExbB
MIKSPTKLGQPFLSKNFLFLTALLAFLFVFICSTPELLAQEVGDEEVQKKTMLDNVLDAGLWMVPLVIASIAMIFFVVYNFIELNANKFNPVELKAGLLDHMQNVRVRSAIEMASGHTSYLGRMVAASLPQFDATNTDDFGREDVDDAVAEFTITNNKKFLTNIGYLGVIGQIAPMLGLLGTVVGMMGAFNTLAAEGQADPSTLAGDIGLAMVTTASGLIIAIPSIFFFFFLRNRFNRLVADCHQDISELLDASYQAANADQIMAKVPEGFQS